MAKSTEKNLARDLRLQGKSIKDIARKVRVSKSTVSLWCRDIELTKQQIAKLQKAMRRGSYIGRMKGARTQYQRRLRLAEELEQEGKTMLGDLSIRDLFMIGVGLYWGEGTKYGRRVSISNSDPVMIPFILEWFRQTWGISNDRFAFNILINEIHSSRLVEVEMFWKNVVKFPNPNFGKTTLIKAKNKKSYSNFPAHFGTLQVRISKPVKIHHKIIGILHQVGKLSS